MLLAPRISHSHFFLTIFFRITHNGWSNRWNTCSLQVPCYLIYNYHVLEYAWGTNYNSEVRKWRHNSDKQNWMVNNLTLIQEHKQVCLKQFLKQEFGLHIPLYTIMLPDSHGVSIICILFLYFACIVIWSAYKEGHTTIPSLNWIETILCQESQLTCITLYSSRVPIGTQSYNFVNLW